MVGPGAQVGSKGGFGSPKLLQVEPTHTSSKQTMFPKLSKFKQSHIQNKHHNYYKISTPNTSKPTRAMPNHTKIVRDHIKHTQTRSNHIKITIKITFKITKQKHIKNH